MIRYKSIQLFIAFLFVVCFSSTSYALFPRAYVAAPAGIFSILYHYDYRDTDGQYRDGSELANDTSINLKAGIVRPVYYFDWLNKRWAVNAILPFGETNLEGIRPPKNLRASSGLIDPTLHVVFFPINQPKNKLWVGISEYLTFPLGDYKNSRLINLGENRFRAKTEIGLVKGIGNYFLDVTANFTVFDANTNFGRRSNKLEQDVLWGFETHLSRNITAKSHVGLGLLWQSGGETSINGVSRDDEPRKTALQLTYSKNITLKHRLAIFYKTDLEVENGFKVNQVQLRYTHVF